MHNQKIFLTAFVLAGLAACDGGSRGNQQFDAQQRTKAPEAATQPPSTDAEFEMLKTIKPVNACNALTPDKLDSVFPGLKFDLQQKIEPQISGYVWDSRCTYWAGLGTIEFAKNAPTHTVELFVTTPVTEAKALAHLASRHDSAKSQSSFRAQPEVGPNAYSVTNTGVATLHFVKGPSEMQINVSDLKTPNDEKVRRAVALAKAL